jgi:lipopolysaccharide biosynthesis regulator YciM
MRVRTFLLILLAFVLAAAVVQTVLDNRELLVTNDIALWGGVRLSVGTCLLLAFCAGMLLTVGVGLVREAGRMIDHRRLRKQSRKLEEIEEEYSRGLVAVLEGREDEALRHFRAVLERDSRHFHTLIKVGEILRGQGRYAEAIEYHRKAHHLKEDNTQPLYALVEDHEAQGDMDRARAVLGRIIAINKQSIAAWRKLRSLHIKEQNWEKALEAHEKVVKLADPHSEHDAADRRFGTGIRHEIAVARLEAGQTKEAIAMLRRLVKDQPAFVPAHVRLGEALRRSGQEAEAVAAWNAGFEATGSPTLLAALEEHYMDREQPLAAIEALKSCISSSRKDTLPRFYLGKLYFRLEMLDDAMAVLSSLEGRATYAPTLHYLLGRIHERRRNDRAAAAEYRKVIQESDLVQLEHGCRACGETHVEWADRCVACGEWNTIEVNFREEIPLEELGVSAAPIYTIRP